MNEEVFGCFGIQRVRALAPNINYILLLTSDRLVAAKFGSVKDSLSAFGMEIPKIPGLAEVGGKIMLDTQTALAADKNNFELSYSYITKVEMKKNCISFSDMGGALADKMVIFTHEKKQGFEIIRGQEFEDCVNLVRSVLSDKVQQ